MRIMDPATNVIYQVPSLGTIAGRHHTRVVNAYINSLFSLQICVSDTRTHYLRLELLPEDTAGVNWKELEVKPMPSLTEDGMVTMLQCTHAVTVRIQLHCT